jgi:peptidyl-tRNA hydrolase
VLEEATDIIERNPLLLQYQDLTLYDHQKEIFTRCKETNPKLVLYMAPTATGKTMTPLGLSEKHRVIFVCAARHVGLALAKAAISVNKKIAFAFGCSSAEDIRLHYFAAKEYTKNKRSGGIQHVDNSDGSLVELMICDVRSYLPAMLYMKSFFEPEDLLLYWDEPTISMDTNQRHPLHAFIHENWKENSIPNIVLSSATLPKEEELGDTISSFMSRRWSSQETPHIYSIISHDCKKSIPIIDQHGYVVLPHTRENPREVARFCEKNLTLLRYFDLDEVVRYIQHKTTPLEISEYFEGVEEITMKSIKVLYLSLVQSSQNSQSSQGQNLMIYSPSSQRIYENTSVDTKGDRITFTKLRSVGPGVPHITTTVPTTTSLYKQMSMELLGLPHTKQPSSSIGLYVSTKDAYTLTDGPTIFITQDTQKVAKFLVQQANIPEAMMKEIMKKLEDNHRITEQLSELEAQVDQWKEKAEEKATNKVSEFHKGQTIAGRSKGGSVRKITRAQEDEAGAPPTLKKLTEQINGLRTLIKPASLNDAFVPNKPAHLERWGPNHQDQQQHQQHQQQPFTSDIDESTVSKIMSLHGVESVWKILLLMGIGIFQQQENEVEYMETMKYLADNQKLYLILASSDYIYGTNYQFCHGYISKDMQLTQEKIIQAMGRIGRNNIQQSYTIRIRDEATLHKLFTYDPEKPEVTNMNRLFNDEGIME